MNRGQPIRIQSFESLSLALRPSALRVVFAVAERVKRSFEATEIELSMSGFRIP